MRRQHKHHSMPSNRPRRRNRKRESRMISIRDLTNRSEVHVARASIISSGITAQPPQYASERKFTSVGQERLRTGLIGSENCELELRWLKDHRAQFAGQWVALQGYRLIAHG